MHSRKMKLIAMLSVVALILAIPFQASAAAGNRNEYENNNTYLTATVTQDDFNNNGTISYAADVDWWKITYSVGGMINIWLGNVPTGCNFDISVYRVDSNGNCAANPCAASV